MTQMIHSVFMAVVIILVASCSSSDKTKQKEAVQDMTKPAEVGTDVPANHCRMIGTIVKIEQEMMGGGDDPCSKVPCVAIVRVDEVLGYGSAFPAPLAVGKDLKVRFSYTTGPTKDLFPGMSPALPGLKPGSRFQADLRASGPLMQGSGDARFQIGLYMMK